MLEEFACGPPSNLIIQDAIYRPAQISRMYHKVCNLLVPIGINRLRSLKRFQPGAGAQSPVRTRRAARAHLCVGFR